MTEPSRRGYVLVVVLLLLLAVTAIGHTLLVLTQSELSVSRARWEALARRLAAETGAELGARRLPPVQSLASGEWTSLIEGSVPPRARFAMAAQRVSPELLLVRSEGRVEQVPGVHRTVAMWWGMSPVARVRAALAVVEAGGPVRLDGGSRVDSAPVRDAPVEWSAARCEPYRSDLDTLFTDGVAPVTDLVEDPRVGLDGGVVNGAARAVLPSLGLLDHELLLAGAGVRTRGTVSPSPAGAYGECDSTDPSNWGAPMDPSDPCSSYMPVVASQGPLVIDGGEGQGVLLSTGDATLSSGARYYGFVIVAGDLTLRDGSAIYGLVRVRGSVFLTGGSAIVGSACAALSALGAAEALQVSMPLPGGSWPDVS